MVNGLYSNVAALCTRRDWHEEASTCEQWFAFMNYSHCLSVDAHSALSCR